MRKETKHCRIFAKQMYGQVTCVAGYRRFRPNVICHASKMHDADSVHRRRRLCMDRGSRRENLKREVRMLRKQHDFRVVSSFGCRFAQEGGKL